MKAFSLIARLQPYGNWKQKKLASQVKCKAQKHSTSSMQQPALNFGGPKAFLQAGLISGTFCAIGDLVSQYLELRFGEIKTATGIKGMRCLRMFGFGFCLYGPLQHVWYNTLAWLYPTSATRHFLSKLVLTQIIWGPSAVSLAFTWVLTLTNQLSSLKEKLKKDLFPTVLNGWKFWIPVASANFRLVPLHSQVLFMSFCSLCWSAYLGYQSNKPHTKKLIST